METENGYSEEKSIKTLEVNREKTIVKTSVIGIIANVFLSAFKAGVGLLASSVAVILDAVNNLSDALSSVITIIGTKLAARKPDKKHPLGHGRIEYITSMIIAAIVLYAGVTALVESIKKIITPELPDFSVLSPVWTLVILGAAVAVKIFLGLYVKKTGKRVNSVSLVASGSDALFDAVISASVFASTVLFLITGISVEAYLGALISLYIIKSGISLIAETLNNILGTRTDREFALEIKKTVCSDPDVHGAFDLYLYNYGPDQNYGSVHVEVYDTMTAVDIDAMTRRIQASVYIKHGVILTGIGIYAVNTGSDEAGQMRKTVMETVMAHEYSMQFHGFYVDMENKSMTFDVVLSFECDRDEALKEISDEISSLYPGYKIHIQPDIDITE